ncbi:MAG TPA: sigma-70 family RNA polymerase sigma factor [Candidatus Paceibacterota bacterium]|nr:sigma-70 family RNA polymerase sigma factor [Candidatus Paceibacterota bacterium]
MYRPEFIKGIIDFIPRLRAFGISLSGNTDRAGDLVQATITRALASKDMFTPGTNLHAWLFTIMYNHYRSEYRKRKREVEDPDSALQASLTSRPDQLDVLELKEAGRLLTQHLPRDQQTALLLVGVLGFRYEEVARREGVRVGTVKSRLNRARTKLKELLEGQQKHVRKAFVPTPPRPRAPSIAPQKISMPLPVQIAVKQPDLVIDDVHFRLLRSDTLLDGSMTHVFAAID